MSVFTPFKELNLNPIDTLTNLFSTGYSIYQDNRNFKYQQSLQDKLFERDDNAMQRRMEDYKKAGINPLFALGSSAAGNSSAGALSSTPLSIDTNFATNQNKARLEREAVKQEMDKRKLDMQIMKIQLRSGKIANWQAMQDLKTKQIEQEVLKEQLKAMQEQGYYPLSTIGKTVQDVATIMQNNNPFNFPVLQPFPNMLSFLFKLTGAQDYVNDKGQPDLIGNIKDNAQKVADWLGTPVIKKKIKPIKPITEYEARVLRGNSDSKVLPYKSDRKGHF